MEMLKMPVRPKNLLSAGQELKEEKMSPTKL
jgi:hypothetical protein